MTKRSSLPTSSLSSSSSSVVKIVKKNFVDLIFMDAHDTCQLPMTDLNIFDMTQHGDYHENVQIKDDSSFNTYLKMNPTFGELFAVDYSVYTISRKFFRALIPTSYRKHNFPSESAIRAICKGKFLVVSPSFRSTTAKEQICTR